MRRFRGKLNDVLERIDRTVWSPELRYRLKEKVTDFSKTKNPAVDLTPHETDIVYRDVDFGGEIPLSKKRDVDIDWSNHAEYRSELRDVPPVKVNQAIADRLKPKLNSPEHRKVKFQEPGATMVVDYNTQRNPATADVVTVWASRRSRNAAPHLWGVQCPEGRHPVDMYIERYGTGELSPEYEAILEKHFGTKDKREMMRLTMGMQNVPVMCRNKIIFVNKKTGDRVAGKGEATMNRERVAGELMEVARILNGEKMLTASEVRAICPACAQKMEEEGISLVSDTLVREAMTASEIREAVHRQADKWESLPKGWTEESVIKFWGSLTGDTKHKITKCMKEMEGKIDDPGAFCGGLASKVGYR